MTDATASAGLRRLTLGDLDHELAQTRRMLAGVPDAHRGWTPHAKSMPLFDLATHLANVPWWGTTMLTSDHYDMAQAPASLEADPDAAAVLARWDANVAALRAALDALPEERLLDTWELRRGGTTTMAAPRAAMLRGWLVSHMIHHRGQLSVYLRLLDVPVPGMYGPSADERPPRQAQPS